MSRLAQRRRTIDIWPGFVDALASLLLVLVFVLLVFALGQFFLTDALTGREQALSRLNAQVAELASMLAMEEETARELEARVDALTATLARTRDERDRFATTLEQTREELATASDELAARTSRIAELERDITLLGELKAELEAEVAAMAGKVEEARAEAATQAELSAEAQAQVTLLNRQLGALRSQLTEIAAALEAAEATIAARDVQIAELGRRLNLALASRVQELAEYRSEFFGRLKQVLGDSPDLRVEGDRFVFQSELLFATGSADLGPDGRAQVRRLANTLKEVAARIPDDLDWVLRVDGHTDRRPISTARFPSNWELSTARALAIVKYLVELGIPPERLAATGFGSFQPIDDRRNELAYARNRRIELKLTAR